jgi:hypothetical protein
MKAVSESRCWNGPVKTAMCRGGDIAAARGTLSPEALRPELW